MGLGQEARNDRLRARLVGSRDDRPGDVVRVGDERRDEDDDHRVDPVVGQHRLQRALVGLASGGRDEVDRVRHRRIRRHEGPELGLGGGIEHGNLEPCALAGIGREDAGTTTVRDDRDPTPGGQWLVHEDLRRVEQLGEGVDAGDAGLAEERVGSDVGGGQRGGVRRRGAGPGAAAAALHREDRLAVADATGQARELARVPERLEVQEDHASSPDRDPRTAGGRCR